MNFHAKSNARAGNAVGIFGDAVRPFLDAGMKPEALIPEAPHDAKVYVRKNGSAAISRDNLGKVPGRYLTKSDEWCGFSREKGEASLLNTGATPEEQRQFTAWPTPNVGVLGRFYPGIDADTNTPAAARIVAKAIAETFGADTFIPRRTRGNSTRGLFVFEAATPGTVTSRSVEFELPAEAKGTTHKMEVSGQGRQYVGAGIHPSGQPYGWDRDNHIDDTRAGDLIVITDADVDRIYDVFTRMLKDAGGLVLSEAFGKANSGNGGTVRDSSRDGPVMRMDAILDGLDELPNTRANFPTHDDFVAMLGAVRAALGSEADTCEDDVRLWATAHEDDTQADDAYFDRTWRSLDAGVRVGQDSLDRRFRQAGIHVSAPHDFPDDAVAADAIAENIKWEADGRNTRRRLLEAVADGWRFKTVNMRTDDTNARVRPAGEVEGEEITSQWWDMKTTDVPARAIVPQIQKVAGWEAGLPGLWQFLTDLKVAHPNVFYVDECQHPLYDIGHMIPEKDAQGNTKYKVNLRPLPEAQKIARRLPVGSGNTNPDTRTVLDYIGRIFGRNESTGSESEELQYELDTLAYMLKTGRRPGNMLILQGDSGTGKSVYSSMLSLIFDGAKAKNLIPGSSLADESAARFAWTPLDGARILQMQELPATKSKTAAAILDSKIKTIVDASEAGDFVSIEAKGKDARMVENHVRVVVTTNLEGAVDIGEQDRRIFYVENRITRANRPGIEWWRSVVEPVTKNTARIAHFIRFLMDRDIGDYDPNAAPPVSDGKAQQQRMGITEPAKRFMHDAVRAFTLAGRSVVELREFLDLMEAASLNEYENLDRKSDEPQKFHAGVKGNVTVNVLKILQKAFTPLDPKTMRTKSKRWTLYVRNASLDAATLNEAHRDDVIDALEKDKLDHPMRPEYLPKAARGPVRVPIGDNFPDE